MQPNVQHLIDKMVRLKSKKKGDLAKRFFKTGPGEYGEGDEFLGIPVPHVRNIAKDLRVSLRDVPVDTVVLSLDQLLTHKYHECRLAALHTLVYLSDWYYKKERVSDIHALSLYYLKRTTYINNWDLVDTSARDILGRSVYIKNDTQILFKLTESKSIWERRIAVIAAWYFTKQGNYKIHIDIISKLENDTHDLIHKACGWMLREIGKENIQVLVKYLDLKAKYIPRTMLRYAIERLSTDERKKYMNMR